MTDAQPDDQPEAELDRAAQWDQFLARWPLASLGDMTLDQYTDDQRDDAFIYWLEFRASGLGGIRGGSAFKFGVARRANRKRRASSGGRAWDARHMWLERHGATAQDAFEDIRRLIVDCADAARAGRLEVIDGLNLSPMVKWKLAFIYQDRANPLIFPIYKHECLFHHYRQSVAPDAVASRTGFAPMYRALSERLHRLDVFERADGLWRSWEEATATPVHRDWLVALAPFGLGGELAEAILASPRVEAADLPLALRAALGSRQVARGDRLALWLDGQVRARGLIEEAPPEGLAWSQTPCARQTTTQPTANIEEITTWRAREAIWGEQPASLTPVAPAQPCPPPRSVIFYGPPGTGKTREALRRALALCGVETDGLDDARIARCAEALERAGRLEVVTFHPSYGYEEFVEGIRPVLGQGGGVQYRVEAGAFKQIALRAAAEGLDGAPMADFETLWERLLAEVRKADGEYLIESLEGTIHALQVTGRGNLEARRLLSMEAEEAWVDEQQRIIPRSLGALAWEHRDGLDPGAQGDAQRLRRQLSALPGAPARLPAELLWPVLRAMEKLAARPVEETAHDPEERVHRARVALQGDRPWHFTASALPHVLIIDEINRGDISRIMGELLTLLEPARRLGGPESTAVRLAVSGERFAVPPNLHVLGTMNTADRSIAMMDVALRRRFTFEERMPRPEVLDAALADADAHWRALVRALFETLNARISFLYDREHQLGHAYFLGATGPGALRRILVERIFPLLQEYFYDSWENICLVLGCPYDEAGLPMRAAPHALTPSRQGPSYAAPMVVAEVCREADVLGINRGERDDRLRYTLHPALLDPETPPERLTAFFEAALQHPRRATGTP